MLGNYSLHTVRNVTVLGRLRLRCAYLHSVSHLPVLSDQLHLMFKLLMRRDHVILESVRGCRLRCLHAVARQWLCARQ